jgi:L-cystine transport system substrate-binding protein
MYDEDGRIDGSFYFDVLGGLAMHCVLCRRGIPFFLAALLILMMPVASGCSNRETLPVRDETKTETAETDSGGASVEMTAAAGKEGDTDNVREVTIAYAQAARPITFTDEDGNASGYDVEVMRLVDERLPGYSFTFVGTSDEDALIGVETGKYDACVKNVFYTEERAKKYLYPAENIGGSNTGLVVRREDAERIYDFTSLSEAGGRLVPIAPSSAQYALVAAHNEKKPDKKVELLAADDFNLVDAYVWVAEKRFDAFVNLKALYNFQVIDQDGPFHHLEEKLVYTGFAAIPTWPLFHKGEEDLAAAYDRVITELKAEGVLSELSETWLGEDVFALLAES